MRNKDWLYVRYLLKGCNYPIGTSYYWMVREPFTGQLMVVFGNYHHEIDFNLG